MLLKSKLKALLSTTQILMNEKKFDDALSFYRKINSIYKNLKDNDQEEFYNEVNSYNFDIMVYFKMKEAMILFEEGKDIELIKSKLLRIEESIDNVNNKVARNFIRDNFTRMLDAYNALTHKDLFATRLLEIHFLLQTNLVESAIDKYYELMPIYNTLARYANYNQRNEMFKLMGEAYEEIQKKLKKENTIETKKIENKEDLERFKYKEIKKTKIKRTNEIKKVQKLKKEVKKVKENISDPLKEAKLLIKEGKVEEAEKLLLRNTP